MKLQVVGVVGDGFRGNLGNHDNPSACRAADFLASPGGIHLKE
jgi:hypothetical protein